jgi:hypothetical protein
MKAWKGGPRLLSCDILPASGAGIVYSILFSKNRHNSSTLRIVDTGGKFANGIWARSRSFSPRTYSAKDVPACQAAYSPGHKVHIYTEYHSVCPLVGIRTLPSPSLASECAPPPQPKGGRAHSPAGKGWGSPNSDDWRKSLALCLLCGPGGPVRP